LFERLRSRAAPIAVSCLLHLGIATGLVVGQHWVTAAIATRPPILPVQLVTLDAPEEPRREPPAPPASPPRAPVRPPRLRKTPPSLDAPPPVKAETRTEATPPPAPIAPAIPAPAPEPVAGGTPVGPVGPSPAPSAPAATIVPSLPAGGPPVASSSATAGARTAAATEAVTQYARPQGGYQVRPTYPAAPRRLGIQGTSLLRVHVLADGRIGDVVVEKSAGHPELDDAAVDAVRRWRFEPARRGAEAIAMWVLLPVEFKLR
jgi:protein TonB